MRTLMGVLALVALPVVASLAQQPPHPAEPPCPTERNANSRCGHNDQAPPPPPPACGATVSSPTATIGGNVTQAGVAVPGVCVQVFDGTTLVTGTLTLTNGSFSIGVAPPSTGANYLVCLVVPTGTTQTFPLVAMGFLACPSGAAGFSAPVTPGGSALGLAYTL